ncbi:hypothetical protein DESA109040_17400 [Deinococcus saxicola]
MPLDRWALRTVAHEVAAWPALPGRVAPALGVNLMAAQMHLPGLVAEVRGVLGRSELAPKRLTLELTENVLMNDRTTTLDTMRTLRELGVGAGSRRFRHRVLVTDTNSDWKVLETPGNPNGVSRRNRVPGVKYRDRRCPDSCTKQTESV